MKYSMRGHRASRLALSLVLCLAPVSPAAAGQREREQRATLTPTGVIDGRTIPAGTVLVLRLETKLDSGSSRPGDRFRTRVIEAVINSRGRELIPQGAVVEGVVESVVPAQKRRRSGVIAVRFDMLRLSDGRALPLEGTLAAADADDRRRIDEEGQVAGGGTTKQTIVFIGGGAGAGAAVGAIIGSAALGAGIGAAAGVFGAWLAKGKEAIVEPGTRLGVELTQPLDVDLGAGSVRRIEPRESREPAREPEEAPVSRERPEMPEREAQNQSSEGILLRWSEVEAERTSDGALRVILTAETSSAGWRVYADHVIDRETLEIWLRGNRPRGMSAQVISYPKITLKVADAEESIRRVLVHGTNGERVVELDDTRGRGEGSGSVGDLGARIADKLEVLVADYAASIGAVRNQGGKYEFNPQRRPEKGQIDLLYALSNLADSAQQLRGTLQANATAAGSEPGVDRLARQAEDVDRRWNAGRASEHVERKWLALRDEIRQLLVAAR